MKNRFNKGFEETKQNKVPKYGIRKLKVGVVSCLLAFSMFAPVVGAHAVVEKGTPQHKDLEVGPRADADRLYDDVNKKLKGIADNIAEELEGIQQLEANIDKAKAEAEAAEKAEKDAKENLAKKKAEYEVKKEECKKAEENYNQRKKEKDAAEKAQKKAEDKYKKADDKLKEAQHDKDTYAGKKASKQEEDDAKAASEKVTKKKEALATAKKGNEKFDKYENVTKAEELADSDPYVKEQVGKDAGVTKAINDAKNNIKFEDKDDSEIFGKELKTLKARIKALTDSTSANDKLKGKAITVVADGKKAKLQCAEQDALNEANKDSEVKEKLDSINTSIDKALEGVNVDSKDEKISKAVKDALTKPDTKKNAYTKLSNEKKDAAKKVAKADQELNEATKDYETKQHIVDAKNTKPDSAEKKVDKAEEKADKAQNALDKANDALETATDNFEAATERFDLAKSAKKDAKDAVDDAHDALLGNSDKVPEVIGAHEKFRIAKQNLRATLKASMDGSDELKLPTEKLGIKGLRNNVAKELKEAEDAYASVKSVVTAREDRIKLYKDLIASTKKFAAMSGDTDAADSFDNTIDTYNDKVEELTDEVADYKERLAESTALITIIRQLAEKAKVLKPRNLKPEGWSQEGSDWTYTDSYGMTVKDNWVQGKNGDWFYLDGFGKMAHDKWVEVNKKWFYAGSNGVIAQEQWIQNKLGDWFYVKKGGYMAQNEWVQVKGQWYYAQKDGNMAKNVTLNVNGVNYSFNANCAWVK